MQCREDVDAVQVIFAGERKGRGLILAPRRGRKRNTAGEYPSEGGEEGRREVGKENEEATKGEEEKSVIPAGTPLYVSRADVGVMYSSFARTHCAMCFLPILTEEKGTTPQSPPPLSTSLSLDENNREASSYACPQCEQFILCPSCVQLVLFDLRRGGRKEDKAFHQGIPSSSSSSSSSWKMELLTHPMLTLHQTLCAWYQELPADVRAPGKDTDYVRFCLAYGAIALHAEKEAQEEEEKKKRQEMGASGSGKKGEEEGEMDAPAHHHHLPPHYLLHKPFYQCLTQLDILEDNLSTQDAQVVEFCHSFAKDKIVAFFGPSGAEAREMEKRKKHMEMKKEKNEDENEEVSPSTLSIPPYPVSGEKLAKILLKVRCNSFGFPFNAKETMGWSVEGTACMINHSCVPNAAVVHADQDEAFLSLPSSSSSSSSSDGMLTGCFGIKSIRPIAEGEEITISYLDVETYDTDVEARTRALLEGFRFLCTCSKCLQQRAAKKAMNGEQRK